MESTVTEINSGAFENLIVPFTRNYACPIFDSQTSD
jgi:hypothetical protein